MKAIKGPILPSIDLTMDLLERFTFGKTTIPVSIPAADLFDLAQNVYQPSTELQIALSEDGSRLLHCNLLASNSVSPKKNTYMCGLHICLYVCDSYNSLFFYLGSGATIAKRFSRC